MIRLLMTWFLGVVCIMAHSTASACSVCFGDPNSKLTESIGWGIWVLMGFIGGVLVLFTVLFLKIRARMKKFSAAH